MAESKHNVTIPRKEYDMAASLIRRHQETLDLLTACVQIEDYDDRIAEYQKIRTAHNAHIIGFATIDEDGMMRLDK